MEFSISFSNGIFELETSGEATLLGYVELFDTLLAHEHWQPGSLVLSEELGLDTTAVETKDIVAIANACGAKRKEIGAAKFAILVPPGLVYGINRMWEAYVEDRWDAETHVFSNRDEAMAWLSV